MKKIYLHKIYTILFFISVVCIGLPANAQKSSRNSTDGDNTHVGMKRTKKAWEIGIGGTGLQMTRFNVINFQTNDKDGYTINTSKRDLLFGGHLYVARELNSHFYLDLQGMLDYSSDPVRNGHESRWVGMAGLGFQWRLGEYFHSSYIDPFLRAGVNYMYKNFNVNYNGIEEFNRKEMGWNLSNDYNKEGDDKHNLLPISLGAGVNMWLNDRIGIGLQGDYLIMPYKHIANSWQGTVRFIWRIGGKSKKVKPEIRYVEKVVEKIIEKPTIVEKVVQAPPHANVLCDLFNNIYFEFDKADITEKSVSIINKIAQIMMTDTNKRYLITGCTDAKGSLQYNMGLSQRRANAVIKALTQQGVPSEMLKSRGVGKKISYAPQDASNEIREGDRKIIVEIITNMDYWNHIP
ncbi:OmpA family protein [Bacteroides helcogenes]|uniref:OmpA/MotB domain protein n=1 Tax=Bacteroides helcogenes (strain ATCC 35417 / DSM 20613 / JCM 6297 / CCUG 15421 / P 36-108) TaxID=693979 RepID=E6SS90_BACT6|nr:OmpA family protein [Bacteroides helcogenes]ADV44158.1 OmpA/MotB domain protein [Bacteroides helcogenes P 36-108]MDY5238429.1 OmpA family protein [Bacteroides helcogenes]